MSWFIKLPIKRRESDTIFWGVKGSENDSALQKELSSFTRAEGMRKEFPLSVVLEFLTMSMYYIDHKREIIKKGHLHSGHSHHISQSSSDTYGSADR